MHMSSSSPSGIAYRHKFWIIKYSEIKKREFFFYSRFNTINIPLTIPCLLRERTDKFKFVVVIGMKSYNVW